MGLSTLSVGCVHVQIVVYGLVCLNDLEYCGEDAEKQSKLGKLTVTIRILSNRAICPCNACVKSVFLLVVNVPV